MTDSEKIDVDVWLRVVHPVPSHQDGYCSFIEWMGLGHSSGVGNWRCKLQEEHYGDLLYGGGSENLDYKPCNCSDHEQCDVYKNRGEN